MTGKARETVLIAAALLSSTVTAALAIALHLHRAECGAARAADPFSCVTAKVQP